MMQRCAQPAEELERDEAEHITPREAIEAATPACGLAPRRPLLARRFGPRAER